MFVELQAKIFFFSNLATLSGHLATLKRVVTFSLRIAELSYKIFFFVLFSSSVVEHRYAITEVRTVIYNPANTVSQIFTFGFVIPRTAFVSKVTLLRYGLRGQRQIFKFFFVCKWHFDTSIRRQVRLDYGQLLISAEAAPQKSIHTTPYILFWLATPQLAWKISWLCDVKLRP